jgi:hypothetical protein
MPPQAFAEGAQGRVSDHISQALLRRVENLLIVGFVVMIALEFCGDVLDASLKTA